MPGKETTAHASGGEMVMIDPVCGMTAMEDTGVRTVYQGKTFLFCSVGCLEKFSADPEHYLKPKGPPSGRAQATSHASDGSYTCPMHPEIRQTTPGACPKCGMALEPRTVAVEEEDPELALMGRRFWASLALALPVFVLAMTADFAPQAIGK